MTDYSGPASTPAGIEVDAESGLMRIDWQDGHQSLFELASLRRHCPCAVCQGEMGLPGAVTRDSAFTTRQTTLVDMREVGRYALQPIWGDGHQSGYYPFEQLRSLCPCPVCRPQTAK